MPTGLFEPVDDGDTLRFVNQDIMHYLIGLAFQKQFLSPKFLLATRRDPITPELFRAFDAHYGAAWESMRLEDGRHHERREE